MTFVATKHSTQQSSEIATLLDGSQLVFSQGRFDNWCIYHIRNGLRHAIRDEEVFSLMQKYTGSIQRFSLYRDFLAVFNRVGSSVNGAVIEHITRMAMQYENAREVQFILTFLYAGMVAEENKDKAMLKKYMKRLGVHQVLVEMMPPKMAANYSRQKKWQELKLECDARGFYNQESA
jgi:hypothetical protein